MQTGSPQISAAGSMRRHPRHARDGTVAGRRVPLGGSADRPLGGGRDRAGRPFVRRRLRPKPAESIEVCARRRLAELAAHATPDSRAFHAELADILLRYMEASLRLPSTRLTSRRFCAPSSAMAT